MDVTVRRLADLTGMIARALVLAATLGGAALAGASAEPGSPGPSDVIGYATLDPGAPSMTWSLPENKPYLYVPYVGAELNGAIATIRIGRDVGAALFQQPYFASRDVSCAPTLGSDGRPDLKWLGSTARLEPGAAGMEPDAVAAPDPETGGYASLILFRKELGPPPGVLIMHRRRTMGSMCRNPAHKLFYNRVFVPAPAGPERLRCFDLTKELEVEDSNKLAFLFTNSDRIVLLRPSDLSGRYRGIRHRFTVTLFDGLDCRGGPLSFKSTIGKSDAIKLDDFGFRDRARSVRIVYESGPLDPYLLPTSRPSGSGVAAAAVNTSARGAVETTGAEKPEPQGAPKMTTELISKPAPGTQAAEAPMAPAPGAPTEAGPAAKEPEPAPPPGPEAEAKTPEPEPAPAPRPRHSEINWTKTARTTPVETEPIPSKSVEPAQPEPSPPKARAPEPAPPPNAVQQTMSKLAPVLPPGERVPPSAASQTFPYPIYEIYRLNYCLNWNKDCGEPAARAWCKARRFRGASGFKIDENIGSLFPTVVLGENRVCAQSVCDGFQEITCVN